MTAGGATALRGGVALLERAMGYTLGGLLLVTPQAMANPTPCRGWDLRTLLSHLNDSLRTLHEAITVRYVGLDPAGAHGGQPAAHGGQSGAHGDPGADYGDPVGAYGAPGADYGDPVADPVGTLRNRGCRMIGAWASARAEGDVTIADRVLSPGIVAATGAVDVAVHGWDVARALGVDRPIPPALAAELLELCRLLVSDADRPARFAAPVDVPPLAGPGDRLVAFLGRDPR